MEAYREEYSKELDRLLPMGEAPSFKPENAYYAIRAGDGRLLAAGVCWRSRIHPSRMRFYISVEPVYQGRGFGTRLFERMRADHPNEKWQGSADLENDIAEWWLRGLGFEFVSRRYWLDAMIADLMDRARSDLPLVRLCEMNQAQEDRLIAMAWTDFISRHAKSDPVSGELDAQLFRALALHEIDHSATCCLMEGDRILAYVICCAMDDWTTGVKFVGSRMEDRENFRAFLREFVNRAFEEKGGLMMEADSFDEDAIMLLRLFGELPDDCIDTYVLDPADEE